MNVTKGAQINQVRYGNKIVTIVATPILLDESKTIVGRDAQKVITVPEDQLVPADPTQKSWGNDEVEVALRDATVVEMNSEEVEVVKTPKKGGKPITTTETQMVPSTVPAFPDITDILWE